MRRTIGLLVALAVLPSGGCTDPPMQEMATTPEASRAALVAALDAWREGASERDLARRSPPLYLMDPDLQRGGRLLDYRIEGNPTPRGTGLVYVVALSLDWGREHTQTQVLYHVVTDPDRTITREEGPLPGSEVPG